MSEEDDEVPYSITDEVPHSILFFDNGMAATCNRQGQQISKYNGRRDEVIKALKDDGIDWRQLPEIN